MILKGIDRRFESFHKISSLSLDDRKSRANELINIFEQRIHGLEEKIYTLEGSIDNKKLESRKKMLLQEEQKGLKRLSSVEKELKSMGRENRDPLRKIRALTGEKIDLEQRIGILEDMPYGY